MSNEQLTEELKRVQNMNRDTLREVFTNETKAAGSIVLIATEKEVYIKSRGLTVFQIIKIFALFISRKF